VVTLFTNNVGNYLQVLSDLSTTNLGPYYRYESGTSMAAAGVSGMLALMQQYFQQQKPSVTNSPALNKALLINEARSVSDQYRLSPSNSVNIEGWGLANLPTTLPTNLSVKGITSGSMLVFDQDRQKALATGQSQTYHVKLDQAAVNKGLR